MYWLAKLFYETETILGSFFVKYETTINIRLFS